MVFIALKWDTTSPLPVAEVAKRKDTNALCVGRQVGWARLREVIYNLCSASLDLEISWLSSKPLRILKFGVRDITAIELSFKRIYHLSKRLPDRGGIQSRCRCDMLMPLDCGFLISD